MTWPGMESICAVCALDETHSISQSPVASLIADTDFSLFSRFLCLCLFYPFNGFNHVQSSTNCLLTFSKTKGNKQ